MTYLCVIKQNIVYLKYSMCKKIFYLLASKEFSFFNSKIFYLLTNYFNIFYLPERHYIYFCLFVCLSIYLFVFFFIFVVSPSPSLSLSPSVVQLRGPCCLRVFASVACKACRSKAAQSHPKALLGRSVLENLEASRSAHFGSFPMISNA